MLAALSLLLLSACNNGDESEFSFSQGVNDSTLSLGPPAPLMTRAINVQALVPIVTLNGESVRMFENENAVGRWSGSFVVPAGTAVSIAVTWIEQFGFRRLELASVTKDIGVINNNTATTLGSKEYTYDIHDDDGDGFSNISERINDTDPYNEFEPGQQSAQVFINQIDANEAPNIDGMWDTSIWPVAQFQDRNRVTLGINNLMVDQGATQADQEPTYRWGAMHDGQHLYLLVALESVAEVQTPFSDSVLEYNDDSVDIFIDGDNSKNSSYDGVNDFHMIIPIFEEGTLIPNNSRSLGRRETVGDRSLPFPEGLEYAACRCDASSIGEYTLEVKIPLEEIGVVLGRPFGIEIQYNDDNDGMARDAKWGWFHPSKTPAGPDTDMTWQNPSIMGAAELTAPP